jgi:acetyl/propionyl-CoA carboxylase alpha subunit
MVACGGEKVEGLTELKAKQAELKTQLAELNTKIQILEGDTSKNAVLVEAKAVTPEIFSTYINVQGKVDAEESVSLSTEMPGTINKINVTAGDEVKKGQVLAETDARVLQQSISDLQINTVLRNQLYEKLRNVWDQ